VVLLHTPGALRVPLCRAPQKIHTFSPRFPRISLATTPRFFFLPKSFLSHEALRNRPPPKAGPGGSELNVLPPPQMGSNLLFLFTPSPFNMGHTYVSRFSRRQVPYLRWRTSSPSTGTAASLACASAFFTSPPDLLPPTDHREPVPPPLIPLSLRSPESFPPVQALFSLPPTQSPLLVLTVWMGFDRLCGTATGVPSKILISQASTWIPPLVKMDLWPLLTSYVPVNVF